MALERAGSDKAAPHLNRVYKGISQPPITNIPIEQIVPAPLHLILGLTKNVIDRIEAECEKYGTHHEFESTLRELGVSRDPHTKGFTGNNVKKMLSENARLLFKECMRGHNDFRERADELLSHMGAIQQIGMKAEFLTAEEIQKLRIASEEFVLLYNDTFEDSTITPKAHILLHHLPDFSQRFGFLGLLSEQGIEALHHRFNMAEKRFMCIKEEEMRWRRILAENSMRNALFDRTLESNVAEEFIRSESE